MDKIESYIKQKENALVLENTDQTVKNLIDLCLDTEDIKYYMLMLDFLDYIDLNPQMPLDEFWDKSRELFWTLKNVLLQNSEKLYAQSEILLEINELEKHYSSFFKLGPVSFTLNTNQMIGLVGENGNGKTTLLRCLAQELEISRGSVTYYFPYESRYDLRTKLVFIPQRTPKWHGSLLSNLKFAAACYGIHGDENEMLSQLIIARMGIRKFRNLGWASLSSGYKMRFELARALLRKSRIMLIDEPLANLDIIAQKTVLDDLRGIVQSPFRPMGILLSSQQLYEVEKNADNVLFLKNGAQKNLLQENQEQVAEEKLLIIEFETSWDIEQIKNAFQELDIRDLQLNGGTYIISFGEQITMGDFQQASLSAEVPLNYFRDITNSTRRFFLK